jgi:hypothetical protein
MEASGLDDNRSDLSADAAARPRDIFVSYARKERERVRPLVEALEKEGYSVFWDRLILPGNAWETLLLEKLNTSSCVIVVWSKLSVKRLWVRIEASVARKNGTLVPVCLDDVDPPLGYMHIQAARLGDGSQGFLELIEGVRARLQRSSDDPPGVAPITTSTLPSVRRRLAFSAPAATVLLVALAAWLPHTPSPKHCVLNREPVDALARKLLRDVRAISVQRTVEPEGKAPFTFLVYQAQEMLKAATIECAYGELRVGSTFDVGAAIDAGMPRDPVVDLPSRSIALTHCQPGDCSERWRYIQYQFELRQRFLLEGEGTGATQTVSAPEELPKSAPHRYDFERLFYVTRGTPVDTATLDAAASIFRQPLRHVPPVWEAGQGELSRWSVDAARIARQLQTPNGPRSKESIDRVYRLDVDGDRKPDWLFQARSGQLYAAEGAGALRSILPAPAAGSLEVYTNDAFPARMLVSGRDVGEASRFWYVFERKGAHALEPRLAALDEAIRLDRHLGRDP